LRHTTMVQLGVEYQSRGNHWCIVLLRPRPLSEYTVPNVHKSHKSAADWIQYPLFKKYNLKEKKITIEI
jgi:hypothetical protein